MSIYSRGMSEELLPSLEKKVSITKGQSIKHIFKARVVNLSCLFVLVNTSIFLTHAEFLKLGLVIMEIDFSVQFSLPKFKIEYLFCSTNNWQKIEHMQLLKLM